MGTAGLFMLPTGVVTEEYTLLHPSNGCGLPRLPLAEATLSYRLVRCSTYLVPLSVVLEGSIGIASVTHLRERLRCLVEGSLGREVPRHRHDDDRTVQHQVQPLLKQSIIYVILYVASTRR